MVVDTFLFIPFVVKFSCTGVFTDVTVVAKQLPLGLDFSLTLAKVELLTVAIGLAS